MRHSALHSNAAPVPESRRLGPGARSAPLDLSLGHIGTQGEKAPGKAIAVEFEPLDLGTTAPGHRAWQRRALVVRPGSPAFLEEELRRLVAALESSPGLQQQLGPDLQAVVGFNPKAKAFVFMVRPAPPACNTGGKVSAGRP